MGDWVVDFVGPGGNAPKMFYFNGDIFNSGVYRRTPPNWTQTFVTAAGRACVWNSQMWAGGAVAMSIHSSPDGIAWAEDWRPVPGVHDHWSGFNAYDDYLRVASRSSAPGPANHFWRRDTGGNWVESPIDQIENNHFFDIINYGSDIYLSAAGTDVYYWTGAAWADEPTLDGLGTTYFTTHQGLLYAACGSGGIYRRSEASGWGLDMSPLGGAWGVGAISVGGDNVLYVAAKDGANSRVYARIGGFWVLHSTAVGVQFRAVIADASGSLFAGAVGGGFYRYELEYDSTPSGNGIPSDSLACDGNGDIIYIAIYDGSANPILITVDLPFAANTVGTLSYNPGAGDAISVKSHYLVGDFSIIAGHFGNNEQVQRSEDGGGTYSDIDPDTWAANKAQPIAIDPNDEEHVLLALDALDDLVEKDSVDAWTTLDAALPFDVGAMAIYDLDPNEIVIARINAGAVMVQYSPNNASTWQDITGALPVTDGIASLELV